jgi:hypothetical protein
MIKSTLKPKNLKKSDNQKRKMAMQNILERLKELELAFCLSPKLTETQTDLLVRKFKRIVKDSDFLMYTKKIIKRDGTYYLVDKEV